MLGGQICRVAPDGAEVPLKLGAGDTWLLMTLLLEGHLAAHVAKRHLRLKDDAMRQRMTRLRRLAQLDIQKVGGRYVLMTDVVVDALRLIELERASRAAPDRRHDYLRQGRALWKGGLPHLDEFPAPSVYADVENAYRECSAFGRRLLIVDDRIARQLADKLGSDHDCETAESYEEYLTFEPRLRDFDLVVVDRHLTPSYLDGKGLDVVRRINRIVDAVPVMMMTFRPDGEKSLAADKMTYGLAESISKSADGDDAVIVSLAKRINGVVREGPLMLACESIRQGMLTSRRRAETRIQHRARGLALEDELRRMAEKADLIEELARRNDLAGARRERTRFLSTWDPS